jgi:hypothetical protein
VIRQPFTDAFGTEVVATEGLSSGDGNAFRVTVGITIGITIGINFGFAFRVIFGFAFRVIFGFAFRVIGLIVFH